MNLVTGVIVQRMHAMAAIDQEAELHFLRCERERMIPRLKKLFSKLDADGSGYAAPAQSVWVMKERSHG